MSSSSRGSFSENIGYNNVRGYFLYIVRFMVEEKPKTFSLYIFNYLSHKSLCFERKT